LPTLADDTPPLTTTLHDEPEPSDFFIVVPRDLLALGPMALAVYAALRSHADNRTGRAWPSHKTIAELAQVSPSSVGKYLHALRDAGWITWFERRRGDGGQTSNVYRVYGSPRHRQTGAPTRENQTPPTVRKVPPSPSDTDELDSLELDPEGTRNRDPETGHADDPLPDSEVDEETQALLDLPHAGNLCRLLADLIEANGSIRPKITRTWLRDMDRLMRLDGRTPEQVESAIRWCQQDEFWRANVLSPSKLRTRYDQMRLQASRDIGRGANRAKDEAAARADDVIRRLQEQEQAMGEA